MKLRPAMVFGSHMVLQRDQPLPVWGTGAQGDTVCVCLGEDSATAPVEDGRWQVLLAPRKVETGLTMTISSQMTAEQIVFVDVAVGEVWLAGGQSNMQFMLRYDEEAATEIPAAEDPLLRFFDYPEVTMPGQTDFGRTEEYGFWRPLTPAHAPYYSAVGYYFARQLRAALGVPVGILGCNYGGSPAMAWMDPEQMRAVPALQEMLDHYEQALSDLDWRADEQMAMARAMEDPAIKRRFDDEVLMGNFDALRQIILPYGERRKPMPVSPRSASAPGVLFQHMVKPVAPYGIRGAIWYQGESDNGPRASHYDSAMKAVRRSWSNLWGRDLPFFQVLLAPFDHWGPIRLPNPEPLSVVRDHQMKLTREEQGFYCVNLMDTGAEDNIHPRVKRPAGERLALLVRKYCYGEKIHADAPELDVARWEEGRVCVRFRHAEGGLHIRGERLAATTLRVNGQTVPFDCELEGETVIISSPEITWAASAELLFAQDNYCIVNLYNEAELPAFPFRTAAPW